MKYKEILLNNKDEKKKDAAQLSEQVESAGIQIQADIFEAKKAVSFAKRSLEKALNNNEFNAITVVEAKRDLIAAEEDVKDLTNLQQELF